ncbi:MFS general substrate transporter [Aspergillus homomorphus CBS 101889]|uniref:MFS general substrate transporter n=1 Tax=Aspergillus homomorphus (strain CBS 101889) TaxID=1450537 RepID=A0A395HI21_ASPHC|nr:MFS general substrate transporter [Aspergillus homomorphus CBS 101889]RAL07153.1 MFS general substrate transporter [Aspergillus homomorphus CBS 101889]
MADLMDKDLEKGKNVDPLLIDETGRIRRLPVPSDDPNDPLNFSVWEKTAIIVCCCWFSIMSLSVVGGLGSVLDVFFQLYGAEGRTTNQVVWLSTFPSLFVGVGNYIILPLALVCGRRPIMLITTVVLLGSLVGCALSQNWGQHLGFRILMGFATGATESLLPLMLAELTFVHQRGTIYGIYWASQNIITSLLTLGSSYEVAALGWRWFYWVFVLTVGVGLVIVVFGCFETRYQRGAIFLQNQAVITDQYGVTRVLNEEEVRAWLAAQNEIGAPGANARPPMKKTYRQMLNPWSGVSAHPVRIVLKTWWQMLESFSSPGVLYATLLASVVLGASVGISLTYNTVLQYNYDWSAASIGLINLGGVFGGLGGMLYAGIFGDRFIVWAAKRAGGVHQPEHHLLLLIAPGLLAVASLILYGFTADGNATWAGPFMGWTLFQVAFVSVLIRTTSFATEAWEKNPGPALVTVVGTKNLVSFGVSYGLNPMVAKYSYPAAMGILAGVVGGVLLLGIPVYILNPKWRQRMSEKKD